MPNSDITDELNENVFSLVALRLKKKTEKEEKLLYCKLCLASVLTKSLHPEHMICIDQFLYLHIDWSTCG